MYWTLLILKRHRRRVARPCNYLFVTNLRQAPPLIPFTAVRAENHTQVGNRFSTWNCMWERRTSSLDIHVCAYRFVNRMLFSFTYICSPGFTYLMSDKLHLVAHLRTEGLRNQSNAFILKWIIWAISSNALLFSQTGELCLGLKVCISRFLRNLVFEYKSRSGKNQFCCGIKLLLLLIII